MMMECPRCGLAQDKDRYCAGCGLDVEQFLAKPKPFFVRLAQNSNLHLTLIGVLILLAGGYIFFVSREHGPSKLASSDRPLSSRDAAVGQAVTQSPAAEKQAARPTTPQPTPAPNVDKPPLPEDVKSATVTPPVPEKELQKLEVSFWEVPREALVTLMGSADKTSEGEGRGYAWNQGSKAFEALQSAGHRISLPRTLSAQGASAQLAFETPATTQETFQFGFYVSVTRSENKEFSLKWDSSLVLPAPDTGTEPANSNLPVVRALAESRSGGTLPLGSQSLVLVVFEPSTRSLKPEYFSRAGDGPWSIFSSEDFRRSTTDWVAVIQAK